jgi:site-specific recombinase XerD
MVRMVEPKATDVPPDVLDDDELSALLKVCSGKAFVDRRDTAIIRLFCEPGSPRVTEMATILVKNLDMRRDAVQIHGKGDKVRVIPFGTKTGQAFERYLRLRAKHRLHESPRLWLGVKSGAMTGSGVAQMLERRAREAGIGHIHPHQLRHTSAHVWADNGGSESDAMELFGWSSPEMPRRYGRSARTARAHRASRRMSLGDRL